MRAGGERGKLRSDSLRMPALRAVDLAMRHGPPALVWRAIAWRNYWFGEAELRFLHRLVDRSRGAIDVGAHKGVYTYHLARLCPHVWAYEPNPRMAGFLSAACGLSVTVRNVAVSDRAGRASLRIPVRDGAPNEGRAGLGAASVAEGEEVLEIPVRTVRLDEEGLEGIGFIKIDVEGHELAVLRGAEALIRSDRPVLLVEVEQRHIRVPIREVLGEIEGLGYAGCFFVGSRMRGLREFDPAVHQRGRDVDRRRPKIYVNNFVFVPRSTPRSFAFLT